MLSKTDSKEEKTMIKEEGIEGSSKPVLRESKQSRCEVQNVSMKKSIKDTGNIPLEVLFSLLLMESYMIIPQFKLSSA